MFLAAVCFQSQGLVLVELSSGPAGHTLVLIQGLKGDNPQNITCQYYHTESKCLEAKHVKLTSYIMAGKIKCLVSLCQDIQVKIDT